MTELYCAIIPVAGLATRTWPLSIPGVVNKSLLPAQDKMLIVAAIDEALEAGVKKIVIVCSKAEQPCFRHLFSPDQPLEIELAKLGKLSDLRVRRAVADYGRIIEYATQDEPRGLGHAIFQARDQSENKPFAVILPDDYFYTGAKKGCTAQMADAFRKTGANIMCAMEVAADEIRRYGIIQGQRDADGSVFVSAVKEKPQSPEEVGGSRMAIMGRDICQPELMDVLKSQPPTAGGEIQLRDAQQRLMMDYGQAFYGYHVSPDRGVRLDYGTLQGRRLAEGALNLLTEGAAVTELARQMSRLA